MTRMLYIVGPPGVGKSSVVAALLTHLGLTRGEPTMIGEKVLWAEPLLIEGEVVGVLLGKDHPDYPGTDRLSMEVPPEAVRWAAGPLPPLVIGEGSRLAIQKFLVPLAERSDVVLTVAHLTALDDVLDARCAGRGSEQSRNWRKVVASTARNVAAAVSGSLVTIDTSTLTAAEVAETLGCLL